LSAATPQTIAAAIDDWRDLDAPSMVPSQCDATETARAAFPQ
jgi:D-amino-acid dehydrogenase